MVDGKLAEDILFEGSQVPMSDAQGNRMMGIVKEVGESTVKMDFNHPMAGKTLNFDVEVVSVRDVTPEDLQGGCSCGECGGDRRRLRRPRRPLQLRRLLRRRKRPFRGGRKPEPFGAAPSGEQIPSNEKPGLPVLFSDFVTKRRLRQVGRR